MATVSLDVELIEKCDRKNAMVGAERLLDSGDLTEVQRRRFVLHFFKGLTIEKLQIWKANASMPFGKAFNMQRKN